MAESPIEKSPREEDEQAKPLSQQTLALPTELKPEKAASPAPPSRPIGVPIQQDAQRSTTSESSRVDPLAFQREALQKAWGGGRDDDWLKRIQAWAKEQKKSAEVTNVLDTTFMYMKVNILYCVARAGDVPTATMLVELGASVCLPARHNGDTKSSALHIACYRFNLDMIIYLRRQGADMQELNVERDQPIHDARCIDTWARPEHTNLHNAMSYKTGVNIVREQGEPNRCRVLCQRSKLTSQEEVELEQVCALDPSIILQRGIIDSGAFSCTWTALHVACATGNKSALEILLRYCNAEEVAICDKDGWTALHCAVARSAIVPSETQTLMAMGKMLLGKNPKLLYVRNFHREDPWRHRLLWRMWYGDFSSKSDPLSQKSSAEFSSVSAVTKYRLYLKNSLPKDEPNVAKYKGSMWVGDVSYENVVLSFWPKNERKLLATVISKDQTKFLEKYYVDELRDMIRPIQTATDVNEPPVEGSESYLKEIPSFLPCCDPELSEIEWTVGKRKLRDFTFLGISDDTEHFKATDVDTSKTCVVDLKFEDGKFIAHVRQDKEVELVDFDKVYTLGAGGVKVAPHCPANGYNIPAWIIGYNLTSWHSFLPNGCLGGVHKDTFPVQGDMTTTDNVLFAYLTMCGKLEKEDRDTLISLLHRTEAIAPGTQGPPAPSRVRTATSHRSAAYITVTNESDPFTAQQILFALNLLPQGQTKEEIRTREMLLLMLLHNACCIGQRRKVERVIQFLRIFRDEWDNGGLLNRPLRVSVGNRNVEQYAVSVAARHGHVECLRLLHSHEADMMVGDGMALKRAIVAKKWSAAEWLVKNCWQGELEGYPSLEGIKEPRSVTVEELKFCHEHKLLNANYHENFICNSSKWVNDPNDMGQARRGPHSDGKVALMVIDLQLDFFTSTKHHANPTLSVVNADDAYATKCADFITFMAKKASVIFLARDWHPAGHFSFASTHTGKQPFDTIVDKRTGKDQMLWPDHCVQKTKGAEVHPAVLQAAKESGVEFVYIDSGIDKDVDSYSTFYDNNKARKSAMHSELVKRGIEDIYMFGIATDFCVCASAIDALTFGFDVFVVKDLCRATFPGTEKRDDERQLERVNQRGGQVQTVYQVTSGQNDSKDGGDSVQSKKAAYSPNESRVIREIMGFAGIRYYMVFQSNVNAAALIKNLNDFDFGSNNPREGELFLTLTGLMNIQKEPFRFKLHGLIFTSHKTENPYHKEHATRYPLHYLMMLSKYAKSVAHQINAQELLISVIKFINENQASSYDEKGQELYRIPSPHQGEESISLVRIAREVPPLCQKDAYRCNCIFHVNNTKVESEILKKMESDKEKPLRSENCMALQHFHAGRCDIQRPTRSTCAVQQRRHAHMFDKNRTSKDAVFSHLINCSPLMLAVRLRLVKVVEAMLVCPLSHPPVVRENTVTGKDIRGDKFSFEDFSDLWFAVPEIKHPDGTIEKKSPAFHYLLRSTLPIQSGVETVYEDYHVVASPECDEFIAIQSAPKHTSALFTYTFHPGCGARRLTLDELTSTKREDEAVAAATALFETALGSSAPKSPETSCHVPPAAEDTESTLPTWSIPCGLQWICEECGAYIHDCYSTDRLDLLEFTRNSLRNAYASLRLAKIFLRATAMYSRVLTVKEEPAESVQIDEDEYISRWIDVSGLYEWSGMYFDEAQNHFCQGDSGLALLFQYMPDVARELCRLGVLQKCPIPSFQKLTELTEKSSCSYLVRRRHLWKATRGGHQLIVYDKGLSILSLIALINDVEFFDWLENFPDFDILSEKPSVRLGYYALHYATFAASVEVLKRLLHWVAKNKSGDVLTSWVNQQAVHDLDEGNLTYAITFDDNESSNLISLRTQCLDREFDPGAYPLPTRSRELEFYGRTTSLGETPLHVLASYGHLPCLGPLLEHKADPMLKTSLESMDAHDIAIALQHRFELQQLETKVRKHDMNFFSNWKEESRLEKEKQDEEVLKKVVERMNDIEEVEVKLATYAAFRFFTEHGLYFVFVVLLIVYTFLFNGHGLTRTREDYFAIDTVQGSLLGGSFSLDFSGNDTGFGKQWNSGIKDISGLSDIVSWCKEPLRGALFPNAGDNVLLGGYLQLIGAIRFQQLLAKPRSCPTKVKQDSECYPAWSWSTNRMDTLPNVTWGQYKKQDTIPIPTLVGFGSGVYYPEEGYAFDIRRNHPDNSTIEEQFGQLDAFFNRATRFIILYFTVYCASVDRFISAKITWEVFESGGVSRTDHFTPIRSSEKEGGSYVLYVILIILVVDLMITELTDMLYTLFEVRMDVREHLRSLADDVMSGLRGDSDRDPNDPYVKMCTALTTNTGSQFIEKRIVVDQTYFKEKRLPVGAAVAAVGRKLRGYFLHMIRFFQVIWIILRNVVGHFMRRWNFIDWIVPILVLIAFALDDSIDRNLKTMRNRFDGDEYLAFEDIARAWTNGNLCLSMATLLAILTLLKCVNCIPHVGPHAAAVVSTIGTVEVGTYVGILLLVIFAFMLCITNAFGYQLEKYRSVHSSFFAVFGMALGDTDYDDMVRVHYFLGPLLFVFTVGFLNIILMNAFIAVVGEAYKEKLQMATQSWAKFMVAGYREKELQLCPLERYRGTVFLTQMKRFWAFVLPKGSAPQRFVRASYLKDVTDIVSPAVKGDDDIETATKMFFCKNPHLSPWNCVPQAVNDVIAENARTHDVSTETILREILKSRFEVSKVLDGLTKEREQQTRK